MMFPTNFKTEASILDFASFLCRSQSWILTGTRAEYQDLPMIVIDQTDTQYVEQYIKSSTQTKGVSPASASPLHIVILNTEAGSFLGDQAELYKLLENKWDIYLSEIRLWCSPLFPGYRSRLSEKKGKPYFEICYNFSETLSYFANNAHPFDSSPSVISSRVPAGMALHHKYETVYFRYDLITGHSFYLLLDPNGGVRHLIHELERALRGAQWYRCSDSQCNSQHPSQLHPLTLQSVILFYELSTQTQEFDNTIKSLLWIETQLHQGSLFEITDSDRFSRYIQRLHEMSRKLITLEHSNQRDASNIERLLQDHQRLGKLWRSHRSKFRIDRNAHDRVKDDLLSLRGFCDDRHRLILNLRQRTNNFITLLYNLITGHDSSINLRISTQSASIASEARKDSTSMKIIAAVTLLYLPPTFVCSLFGTNLIALDSPKQTNIGDFQISSYWWIYLVFAVPLTAATMGGFLLWRRAREKANADRGPLSGSRLFHQSDIDGGIYDGYP